MRDRVEITSFLLNEIKWFTMMTLLSIIQTVILVGYIVYTLNVTGTIMIGLVVMLFRYQYELHNVFFELSFLVSSNNCNTGTMYHEQI